MNGYLYILWSKSFDYDGENSLYKFGCTQWIEYRKFHSCYVTAFNTPCKYVKYFKFKIKERIELLRMEKIIIDFLKNNGHFNYDSPGKEMFNISSEMLIEIVKNKLYEYGYIYTIYDDDIDNKPSKKEMQKYEITEPAYHFFYNEDVFSLIKHLHNNGEKLSNTQLDWIKEQDWTYNGEKVLDLSVQKRCCFCNKFIKNLYIITNNYSNFTLYSGIDCVK